MFAKAPADDRLNIERAVLERFREVAQSPEGHFAYPTGREGLRGLGYPPSFVDNLPDRVAQCYCGVGNPFLPGAPAAGERVLDIGCGAGVDVLFAALHVGDGGRVEGLELSADMLERARENAALMGLQAGFVQAGALPLPEADASFDLVISNGVFNLLPDKPAALAEVFRVLAPGGRFQLADQVQAEVPAGGVGGLGGMAGQSCPMPPPGGPDAAYWAK